MCRSEERKARSWRGRFWGSHASHLAQIGNDACLGRSSTATWENGSSSFVDLQTLDVIGKVHERCRFFQNKLGYHDKEAWTLRGGPPENLSWIANRKFAICDGDSRIWGRKSVYVYNSSRCS